MPKLTIGQNLRETLDNSFTETFGNKPERYFPAPGRTEIGGNHTDHQRGLGFVAFVRRIKMNHAVALLLNTRTSVADIASMVGYENPESFIRVFQKVYQMSPTAYRKKVTGE